MQKSILEKSASNSNLKTIQLKAQFIKDWYNKKTAEMPFLRMGSYGFETLHNSHDQAGWTQMPAIYCTGAQRFNVGNNTFICALASFSVIPAFAVTM